MWQKVLKCLHGHMNHRKVLYSIRTIIAVIGVFSLYYVIARDSTCQNQTAHAIFSPKFYLKKSLLKLYLWKLFPLELVSMFYSEHPYAAQKLSFNFCQKYFAYNMKYNLYLGSNTINLIYSSSCLSTHSWNYVAGQKKREKRGPEEVLQTANGRLQSLCCTYMICIFWNGSCDLCCSTEECPWGPHPADSKTCFHIWSAIQGHHIASWNYFN